MVWVEIISIRFCYEGSESGAKWAAESVLCSALGKLVLSWCSLKWEQHSGILLTICTFFMQMIVYHIRQSHSYLPMGHDGTNTIYAAAMTAAVALVILFFQPQTDSIEPFGSNPNESLRPPLVSWRRGRHSSVDAILAGPSPNGSFSIHVVVCDASSMRIARSSNSTDHSLFGPGNRPSDVFQGLPPRSFGSARNHGQVTLFRR